MSVSTTFQIDVAGTKVPAGIHVLRVEIENHRHLPDSFRIVIRDDSHKAIKDARFEFGAKVKVAVLSGNDHAPVPLLTGLVTAMETQLDQRGTTTTIRGYDESHPLTRGRRTQSWLKMSPSDVVRDVLKRNQLDEGTIDGTASREHVAQINESDWSLLCRLADECGLEVTVADGKLHFRKPPSASAAPTGNGYHSTKPDVLVAGQNLHRARVWSSAAEQVDNVIVRAWDREKKAPVTGSAKPETTGVENGTDGATAAGKFTSSPTMVVTSRKVTDPKQATESAEAHANAITASHTEVEGEASGHPSLKAGTKVTIDKLGEPFDGKYVLTSTRHVYDGTGYTTRFTSTGEHDRSTLSLTSGTTTNDSAAGGVILGLVDDVDDPEKAGRCRLRFPGISDDYVSDWSPVVHIGAGTKRGMFFPPAKDDQVLVAFEHGDWERPIVLGGLYSSVDPPPTGPGQLFDDTAKRFNNRGVTSFKGHCLFFNDSMNEAAIHLQTSNEKLSLHLDEAKNTLTIRADGPLKLQGQSVDIEATGGNVKVSGTQILLNS